MKRDRFCTMGSQGLALLIETTRDCNGRYYICYKPHVSVLLDNRKAVLKWAGYPTQTDTRTGLDAWLQAIEAADIQRKGGSLEQDEALLKATGFGPEAFDEDPIANTRMIT
jgi:hypothetical protein